MRMSRPGSRAPSMPPSLAPSRAPSTCGSADDVRSLPRDVQEADPLFRAHIRKSFGWCVCEGTVVAVDVDAASHERLYHVEYNDGDEEHLAAVDVQSLLCRASPTADSVMNIAPAMLGVSGALGCTSWPASRGSMSGAPTPVRASHTSESLLGAFSRSQVREPLLGFQPPALLSGMRQYGPYGSIGLAELHANLGRCGVGVAVMALAAALACLWATAAVIGLLGGAGTDPQELPAWTQDIISPPWADEASTGPTSFQASGVVPHFAASPIAPAWTNQARPLEPVGDLAEVRPVFFQPNLAEAQPAVPLQPQQEVKEEPPAQTHVAEHLPPVDHDSLQAAAAPPAAPSADPPATWEVSIDIADREEHAHDAGEQEEMPAWDPTEMWKEIKSTYVGLTSELEIETGNFSNPIWLGWFMAALFAFYLFRKPAAAAMHTPEAAPQVPAGAPVRERSPGFAAVASPLPQVDPPHAFQAASPPRQATSIPLVQVSPEAVEDSPPPPQAMQAPPAPAPAPWAPGAQKLSTAMKAFPLAPAARGPPAAAPAAQAPPKPAPAPLAPSNLAPSAALKEAMLVPEPFPDMLWTPAVPVAQASLVAASVAQAPLKMELAASPPPAAHMLRKRSASSVDFEISSSPRIQRPVPRNKFLRTEPRFRYTTALRKLRDMGFEDSQDLREMLTMASGSVPLVLQQCAI